MALSLRAILAGSPSRRPPAVRWRWLTSRHSVSSPSVSLGRDFHAHAALRQGSLGGLSSIVSPPSDVTSLIHGYDRHGFTVNGINMRGSVLVFGAFTLLWNVPRVIDITPRLAAPVHMVRPKVDLFLIGTGEHTVNIHPALYGYFSRKGIAVEAMSTLHAISSFNTLIAEGRRVAAGLISTQPVTRDDACLYTDDYVESAADVRLARELRNAPDKTRLLSGAEGSAASASAAPRVVVASSRKEEGDRGHSQSRASEGSSSDANANARAHSGAAGISATGGAPTTVIAYGYPGAISPNAAVALPVEDAETRRQRLAARRSAAGGSRGEAALKRSAMMSKDGGEKR